MTTPEMRGDGLEHLYHKGHPAAAFFKSHGYDIVPWHINSGWIAVKMTGGTQSSIDAKQAKEIYHLLTTTVREAKREVLEKVIKGSAFHNPKHTHPTVKGWLIEKSVVDQLLAELNDGEVK